MRAVYTLSSLVGYEEKKDMPSEYDIKKMIISTLAGISAILDAKMNKKTQEVLEKIFGEQEEIYMQFSNDLKALLIAGRLHQSAFLCEWMLSYHFDERCDIAPAYKASLNSKTSSPL